MNIIKRLYNQIIDNQRKTIYPPLNSLEWTCHICGKKRSDSNIDVFTYLLKDLPGAERNVRYCNDNLECRKKAEEKSKTGKL